MKYYTSKEVAEILGIQQQSVSVRYRSHDIGEKIGGRLFFTDEDVDKLKVSDGRRK